MEWCGVNADTLLVSFDGPDDQQNPQNWPASKKAIVTAFLSAIGFVVGFGSSIDTPVIPQASEHFHVSDVSESLATALFLIGFGVGAPFAGPLSESFGRNPIYMITMALFCCWILGAALAPNLGGQLVFRFLAGLFGGTPFTTSGGTMGDIFNHQTRGKVFPFFACMAFLGPMLGPVVGGYVGHSGIDWRWCEWITLCMAGALLILMVLFMPETCAPVILAWKAKALRSATGNVNFVGPLEAAGATSLGQKLAQALSRPFLILFTEPLVIAFTGYLSLVYIVMFSFFASAPFVFGGTYGFNEGASYLMFIAIAVGLFIATLATPLFGILVKKEYMKAVAQGKSHADPEAMLWWAMIGAPFLPASLFWMGWSAYPSVSFWSPMIAAAVLGFSVLLIFISTYAYLIQTFVSFAASALVSITLVRYILGGCMVTISIPMYKNLGVHHSLTILAAIACAFTPIPYVLYLYGGRVRAASKRAPQPKV
ncbi:hypothetical protein M409DRAFT_64294 [Zasmidium cellare ATCC 36951]|uniref:Major facilitator superfamily (MFS) profile domain-containing protein n=1 Tax=Zasmidium cellare ATCC 36951 TaxID=1080233 RepID=A0A6A6CTZ6_ZASCE|nr:uncharacterized protein M409DRAFT_64294 [Zasmidium cellare ATCC 36951]KAF2170624.1 hypothetical protein M409DRAFT_64294 [Zasmidium cellare ATCC 36951]